ncbi:MAG: hypothetical protein ACREAA_10085 [Candidatus Polarisedimenticolia bacterium]
MGAWPTRSGSRPSSWKAGPCIAATTRLEAEAPGWKLVLLTSSPGILLATLGTVLMIVTILARAEVQVTDSAVYLPQAEGAVDPQGSAKEELLKKVQGTD